MQVFLVMESTRSNSRYLLIVRGERRGKHYIKGLAYSRANVFDNSNLAKYGVLTEFPHEKQEQEGA